MAYLIILTIEMELDSLGEVELIAAKLSDSIFMQTNATVSWELAPLYDVPDSST